MREIIPRVPGRRRRLAAAGLALSGFVLLAGATRSEEEVLRQVKVDVFDQKWQEVLRGCEELLDRHPTGPSGAQVAFYRARALSRIPGREAEGLQAFRQFVGRFPEEKVLTEEAWAAIFALACDPGHSARPDCAATLARGLEDRSTYISTLAAIRASDVQDDPVRRKAMVRLKAAYAVQTDPEIRNQILLAILKIDPRQVPGTEASRPDRRPAAGPAPGAAAGARQGPSLIRMTVFDKKEKRFHVKVNLPVGFARALLDALGEEEKQDLRREAQKEGVDLDDIFEAIRKSGAGKLLEVDDEESHIEIWIE